jgi:mono/diheme cytochrome c family protein
MKISNIQSFKRFNKVCQLALFLVVSLLSFQVVGQGEALFKSKCATCHQPLKNSTGPKLYQVRDKWASGGAKEGSIYQWVNNWQTAAASDPYAADVSKWSPTAMSAFPDLKKEQIDAIFDWVDTQKEAPTATGDTGDKMTPGSEGEGAEEESSLSWIWIVMGVVFMVIILAVGGVRRQLKVATSENPDAQEKLTYGEEFRVWAWKNRLYVGISSLIIVLSVIVTLFQGLYRINVVEDYQPSQPIAFPHDRHAGVNGIDCKYCHNSVTKSKSAGIPSVNVCMNCHKQINGEGKPFAGEIKKIYEAAGWDVSSGAGKYTGKTKPIVWNKVHVLPDHVYFNHSQHVVVGGIDCKQCHGDMTQMNETVKVQPVEELNKIEGNIKLTKPTLTMGWCIECHGAKDVALGNGKNAYYDEIHRRLMNNDKTLYRKYLKDGKVSVSELGGWECAKCHY